MGLYDWIVGLAELMEPMLPWGGAFLAVFLAFFLERWWERRRDTSDLQQKLKKLQQAILSEAQWNVNTFRVLDEPAFSSSPRGTSYRFQVDALRAAFESRMALEFDPGRIEKMQKAYYAACAANDKAVPLDYLPEIGIDQMMEQQRKLLESRAWNYQKAAFANFELLLRETGSWLETTEEAVLREPTR